MERDRISIALAEKDKRVSELHQAHEKATAELITQKKENRELKSKIDEMGRQERIIR